MLPVRGIRHNILYKNKDKIGGFANNDYWSSTEDGNFTAWVQYFSDGGQYSYSFGTPFINVMAVRAF